MQVVSPEKLLIFKNQDGWEPLCKFLGVPVPDVPYPHLNKGGSVTEEVAANSYIFEPIKRDVKISLAIIAISIALLIVMAILLGIYT